MKIHVMGYVAAGLLVAGTGIAHAAQKRSAAPAATTVRMTFERDPQRAETRPLIRPFSVLKVKDSRGISPSSSSEDDDRVLLGIRMSF